MLIRVMFCWIRIENSNGGGIFGTKVAQRESNKIKVSYLDKLLKEALIISSF